MNSGINQGRCQFNVTSSSSPPQEYKFFFLLDDKVDGIPEGKWVDSVEVTVQ